MKRISTLFFLGICLATGLAGCKKDSDSAPLPVDGLKAYSGKYRSKVEFTVPADAKSGKVYHGTGHFVEFTVTNPADLQSVIIPDLPEEEQVLRVVTYNGDGSVSEPRGIKVRVFGNNYEGALKPRKWADQVTNSATSIELKFDAATEGETGAWIVYTNTAGAADSVWMASSATTVDVNDINVDEPYFLYSVYKPEIESLDEYYSAHLDLKTALMLDFKKEGWTIAAVSDEAANGAASNLIDNNINTAWQSLTGSAFPHSVTIDFASPKIVDGFNFVNFQGSNGKGAKNIRFELSDDNSSFTTVLETQVLDIYTKQTLALPASKSGQYLRITVIDSWALGATATQFGEIDVYNIQNISAENGFDSFPATGTAVALVNAKPPFKGDGSNPFPPLGEFRMQKLQGWTHNASAVVSYDDAAKAFSLFTASVWGLSEVTNGKVYQTVNLQPGYYRLKIMVAHADGPVDAYGVVAAAGTMPDYTNVPSDNNTYKFIDLDANQNKTVETIFSVTTAGPVNIGIVYNIREQYSTTGTPWSSFNLNGLELAKIQ